MTDPEIAARLAELASEQLPYPARVALSAVRHDLHVAGVAVEVDIVSAAARAVREPASLTKEDLRCLLKGGGADARKLLLRVSNASGAHRAYRGMLEPNAAPAQLTLQAADLAQDEVVGHQWQIWPQCPEHAHPLRATMVDEAAQWVCPHDSNIRILVGEYEPTKH